jgi:CheY-like chemotaxis protein
LEIALEKNLDEDTKDILEKSHSASQSLVYVVDDLLNLTNSQDTNFAMLEAAFDIKAGMAEILEPLQAHAQRKSLLFINDIRPDGFPTFVKGDLQRFQQTLSQVVSNAIRHTTEGSITVESKAVSTNGSYCLLETAVRDTGEGLTSEELDNIFQDLEQVTTDDPSDDVHAPAIASGELFPPKRPQSGARLGLGLALVARFILLHDGQLKIRSTKNEGTLVTLSLPWMVCSESSHPFQTLASLPTPPSEANRRHLQQQQQQHFSPHASPQSPPEMSEPMTGFFDPPVTKPDNSDAQTPLYSEVSITTTGPASKRMVVAIADDNTINLQVLRRRLEMMGHKVLASRDGQECFELFQENSSDTQFVLMDLDVREQFA